MKSSENKIRIQNRSLARKKKFSNNFKKASQILSKSYEKIKNQRKDFMYKLVNHLTKNYSFLSLEDLKVKNLSRGMLSKSFHNASWSLFTSILEFKAESAGIPIEYVAPKFTSQTCPCCGKVEKKSLAQREHKCECGYFGDRDVVAAQNILLKSKHSGAWIVPLEHKIEQWFKSAPRSCFL